MTFFRSFVFNFAFWFWTGIVVIGCLPVLAGPRSWVIATQRFWSVGALVLARFLVGIRYEVRGLEHVPDGAAIFACKHQSSFETIVASVLLPRAAIVMKKELLGIPFYGWYSLRMGMIPVDRSGSAGAMRRMLRSAESAAEEGRPIVIFPEGSRAAAGTKGIYHPGIAGLYRHLGVPVVPMALNSGIFWPRRKIVKHSGTIIVEYLPPMMPGHDRKTFMHDLETRVETATDALLAEAGFEPVDKP